MTWPAREGDHPHRCRLAQEALRAAGLTEPPLPREWSRAHELVVVTSGGEYELRNSAEVYWEEDLIAHLLADGRVHERKDEMTRTVVDKNRLTPQQLLEEGIVQEINRLVLHPRGLVLGVYVDTATKTPESCPVADVGHVFIETVDDPTGMIFADGPDPLKAEKFARRREEREQARLDELGYVVQPVK